MAAAAIMLPGAAYAQSTGSTDFEGEDIVVTATRTTDTSIIIPDVPKSRVGIGADLISRQRPGQSVNEIINLLPGVSFQSNDATGAGTAGTFTIRGFDSSRISQTLDGIPLNDTGNYAIYSQQQQDSETLESVSVNLGTTDVDSPTASAVGGTVNIRTRVPSKQFGAMLSAYYGQYAGREDPLNRGMFRLFGMIETGDIAGTGVRAFISGSRVDADNVFNNYGRVKKTQVNGRIYKSLGEKGDFVSLSGLWNEGRSNFFGSVPLRTDLTATPFVTPSVARIVGPNTANRAPLTAADRFYAINYPCLVNTTARSGLADNTAASPAAPTAGAGCGTEFDRRYNPGNTGNVRLGSRFTLSDRLVFTLDASYQYVKANGGGTVTLREGCGALNNANATTCTGTTFNGVLNTGGNAGNNGSPTGFNYYVGRDLNGDGDLLDAITGVAPSQTGTNRYGMVAGLAYELSDDHRVRLSYTLDYGRHRQTGEVGLVQMNGEPFDVFPINNGLKDGAGALLEKRDRKSLAILNQVSGEYRGKFNDLTVVVGVRAPFFKRDLTQNCFTNAANGNVSCISPGQVAAYAAANPYTYFAPGVTTVGAVNRPTTALTSCAVTTSACVVGYAAPQKRVFDYNRVLPNLGLTYNLSGGSSVYFSYAKGLSVPSTDNLYNSFYYALSAPQARPAPETTDSVDVGYRYNSGPVQAMLAGWYTKFQNRTASVYDPETDTSVYRNLGSVDKYGVDASIAFKPVPNVLLYVFGSYLHSKIKDNIEAGRILTATGGVTTVAAVEYFQTAGKKEGGSPDFTFGGRAQVTLGLLDIGIQAKYTGARFVNDENLPVSACVNSTTGASITVVGGLCPTTANVGATFANAAATEFQIYGAKIPSYTIVDLDLRFNLGRLMGDNRKTFFQLNVSNLFDTVYIGGLSGSSGFVGLPNRYTVGNAVIGTPRSITGSLVFAF
ncbi:MAG: TonB-dependent receptor [Sphingomonas sp.]